MCNTLGRLDFRLFTVVLSQNLLFVTILNLTGAHSKSCYFLTIWREFLWSFLIWSLDMHPLKLTWHEKANLKNRLKSYTLMCSWINIGCSVINGKKKEHSWEYFSYQQVLHKSTLRNNWAEQIFFWIAYDNLRTFISYIYTFNIIFTRLWIPQWCLQMMTKFTFSHGCAKYILKFISSLSVCIWKVSIVAEISSIHFESRCKVALCLCIIGWT